MRVKLWSGIFFLMMLWSTGGALPLVVASAAQSVARTDSLFPVPEIPTLMTEPYDRITYVLLHYWDRIDFKQRVLGTKDEMLEQAFVDFLFLSDYAPSPIVAEAVHRLVEHAVVSPRRVPPLMELAGKYLYHPNSPMLNEERYRLFVEEMLKRELPGAGDRERCRMELAAMDVNRVGTPAADFAFTLDSGGEGTLYELCGERLLLMFYDPDCDECAFVLSRMKASATLARGIRRQTLRLLVVSVAEDEAVAGGGSALPDGWIGARVKTSPDFDEGYRLRAMPTLFLLDHDKVVLLKDASLNGIEKYLR